MSTHSKAQQLAYESAQRRVHESLRTLPEAQSSGRRAAVIAAAALLFAVTFVVRVAVKDPSSLIANFYTVPIALLAIEFGTRGGLIGAAVGLVLVYAWGVVDSVQVGWLGYVSRGAAFVLIGGLVGRFSERLRQDIAARQRAQRELSLYAEELQLANGHLAQSVARLEAFAQIARAVAGQTDLQRILLVILEQGRQIVHASSLVVCLRDGDEFVAVADPASGALAPQRFALQGSLAGEVLAEGRPRRVTAVDEGLRVGVLAGAAQTAQASQAAILVPLEFRGDAIGVLAAIGPGDGRRFGAEDEQLLLSVATSAATAVATARSVAAERLRMSLEAAEQARGRWARELHDETLQGLSGVRMVLSAGLARGTLTALRQAAGAADEHLGAELQRLRDLITELRPAALDDLGLGPAIETLAQRQAAAGGFVVDTELALDSDERLTRETESTIYRLVQEALTNAAKHAAAQRVTVSVTRAGDRVEICVQDDGCGFETAAARGGLGLVGMRERAMLAGGQLVISSSCGGPTRVSAVLPAPGRRGSSTPAFGVATGLAV